jgi:hypothetical protein
MDIPIDQPIRTDNVAMIRILLAALQLSSKQVVSHSQKLRLPELRTLRKRVGIAQPYKLRVWRSFANWKSGGNRNVYFA